MLLTPDGSILATDLPDEEIITIEMQKRWKFYSTARIPTREKQENIENNRTRVGDSFCYPVHAILSYYFALQKGCSINTAEHEVVIAGLKLTL